MFLGRMLAEAIGKASARDSELPADSVAVVPVSLHRTKLRQRGFNQAETDCAGRGKKVEPGAEIVLTFVRGSSKRKRETASVKLALPCHQRREGICGVLSR